jgi:hypothetical protein
MPTYALCSSAEAQCSLSYNSSVLNRLHGIMQMIRARRSRGLDIPEGIVTHLRRFRVFYQISAECFECRRPLVTLIQPTRGIAQGNKELAKSIELNRLLDYIPELQNLGILAR